MQIFDHLFLKKDYKLLSIDYILTFVSMKLQRFITSKGETWYSITKKLTEDTSGIDFNNMKQKIIRYLKNDDLTLKQYQLFATALGMPLKKLLDDLGRLV